MVSVQIVKDVTLDTLFQNLICMFAIYKCYESTIYCLFSVVLYDKSFSDDRNDIHPA